MLNRTVAAVLAALVLNSVAWADSAEDLKKLQGAWQVTKGVTGGREVAKEVADDSKFMIENDVMSFESSRDKNSAKIKLDAGKSPRTLDAEVMDGAEQGKKRLAIYELSGDTLKLCWTRGEKRPEKFEGKEMDVIYLELKRVK